MELPLITQERINLVSKIVVNCVSDDWIALSAISLVRKTGGGGGSEHAS